MTFGEKLKNIRIGCKKNQSEVCKAIGVSTRTLGFYENGEHLPKSAETYKKLSEYFNVPVEFWTTESEDDFNKCAEYAYGSSGKMQAEKMANEIVGLFAGGQLSEEDADKVMEVMQKAYWEIKIRKSKEKESSV